MPSDQDSIPSPPALRVLIAGAVLAQPIGGVRRHNAELLPRVASRLAAAGGSLEILTGSDGLPFSLPGNVALHPSDVPTGGPLARWRSESRALRRAVEAASEAGRPFDFVHAAHFPAPRVRGVAHSLTIHDLRSLFLPHAPLSRRIAARIVIGSAIRRARAVLTVSAQVHAQLRASFDVPAHKLALVPNAADHLPLLPRSPREGAPLLHVGHLEPRKNLSLLVRVLSRDPSLPRLELVGQSKRGESEKLQRLADQLEVADRIEFVGAVDDEELARRYARAACLVLPSSLEGFGIPVLEAQRAGLPVAVSNQGALPEVAGPNTPTFSPTDVAGCAQAVRRALEQPASEVRTAQARAESFCWDASADRWIEAWRIAYSPRTNKTPR